MFKLFDKFKRGDPSSKVGSDWFNKVAAFLNSFTVETKGAGLTATIRKPDSPSSTDPVKIVIESTGGGGTSDVELGDMVPYPDMMDGDAGTHELASREDHSHPLNAPAANVGGTTGNYPTRPPSGMGNTGTSDHYARSDHAHPLQPVPAASSEIPWADGGFGGAGNSNDYSRANHVHPLSPSYATPVYDNGVLVDIYELIGRINDIWDYMDVVDKEITDIWDYMGGLDGEVNYIWDYLGSLDSQFASVQDIIDVWDEVKDIWDYMELLEGGEGVALGNATPLTDSSNGVIGVAEVASREDHRHPRNSTLNNANSQPVGSANLARVNVNDTEYAMASHAHADAFVSLGATWLSIPAPATATVTVGGSSTYVGGTLTGTTSPETANTTTWAPTPTGTQGVDLRVLTRVLYDPRTPLLRQFYRTIRIGSNGRIISISGETRVDIATPVAHT